MGNCIVIAFPVEKGFVQKFLHLLISGVSKAILIHVILLITVFLNTFQIFPTYIIIRI